MDFSLNASSTKHSIHDAKDRATTLLQNCFNCVTAPAKISSTGSPLDTTSSGISSSHIPCSISECLVPYTQKNFTNNDTNNDTSMVSLNTIYFQPGTLVAFHCAYAILLVVGLLGNALTCYVIVQRRSTMRRAIHLYTFNLAVADLLILFVYVPNQMFIIEEQLRFVHIFLSPNKLRIFLRVLYFRIRACKHVLDANYKFPCEYINRKRILPYMIFYSF